MVHTLIMEREIVIARPGEEKTFITEARRLGWKKLLILYEEQDAKTLPEEPLPENLHGLEVSAGVLLYKEKVPQWSQRFSEVAALGTMILQVPKGVTLLCDNEYEREKDFTHQRRSGVSHVTMATCKERGIRLAVGIARFFSEDKSRRAQILGRIMQNKKLAAKKNVGYEIVSMARRPEEMRSPVDVNALKRVLE